MLFSFFFRKSEVWWRQEIFFKDSPLRSCYWVSSLFFTDLIPWVSFFTMVLLLFSFHVELEIQHLLLPPPKKPQTNLVLMVLSHKIILGSPNSTLNKSLLMLSECLWERAVSPWEALRPCLAQAHLQVQDRLGASCRVAPTHWDSGCLISEPEFRFPARLWNLCVALGKSLQLSG